jgi:hypothetical protein
MLGAEMNVGDPDRPELHPAIRKRFRIGDHVEMSSCQT